MGFNFLFDLRDFINQLIKPVFIKSVLIRILLSGNLFMKLIILWIRFCKISYLLINSLDFIIFGGLVGLLNGD